MTDDEKKPLIATSRRDFIAAAAVIGLSSSAAWATPVGACKSGEKCVPERNAIQTALQPWFEAYLAAFNRGDSAGYGAYYADDVKFHGQAATLVGRDAVLNFYKGVREHLHETVDLLTFVGSATGGNILAELRTTLVAHKDWPDMPTGAMVAGDTRQSVNFAMYDIVDGRFTRIRSARFSPPRKDAA